MIALQMNVDNSLDGSGEPWAREKGGEPTR